MLQDPKYSKEEVQLKQYCEWMKKIQIQFFDLGDQLM